MEKLFTYGSLQLSHIQEKLFNRILSGTSDTLSNYEKGTIEVEGKTFNTANAKPGSSINGTVYNLEQHELERADRYEGKAYTRIKVKLLSGIECWLYLRV